MVAARRALLSSDNSYVKNASVQTKKYQPKSDNKNIRLGERKVAKQMVAENKNIQVLCHSLSLLIQHLNMNRDFYLDVYTILKRIILNHFNEKRGAAVV